jgi:hypothetical protein
MKIALLGSRGIPNIHGGFEQFAEYLSVGLVEYGHEVSVYTSNNHPIKQSTYKGVNIIHIKDPEDRLGTFGQFLYDYNCIRHVRKQNFDIIYQLGYTSSSIWGGYSQWINVSLQQIWMVWNGNVQNIRNRYVYFCGLQRDLL